MSIGILKKVKKPTDFYLNKTVVVNKLNDLRNKKTNKQIKTLVRYE